MAHQLSIDVQDGAFNSKFLYIADLSVYDNMLPVNHRTLQILTPHDDVYKVVPFPTGQVTAYGSNQLGLSDGVPQSLPDGKYKIHFSVAPNNIVATEVCHYRVANLMNKVLAKMAAVSIECTNTIDECGNVEINKYQNSLLHIWMLVNAAQSAGRDDLMEKQAKELYRQAQASFDKLYSDNCKIC